MTILAVLQPDSDRKVVPCKVLGWRLHKPWLLQCHKCSIWTVEVLEQTTWVFHWGTLCTLWHTSGASATQHPEMKMNTY